MDLPISPVATASVTPVPDAQIAEEIGLVEGCVYVQVLPFPSAAKAIIDEVENEFKHCNICMFFEPHCGCYVLLTKRKDVMAIRQYTITTISRAISARTHPPIPLGVQVNEEDWDSVRYPSCFRGIGHMTFIDALAKAPFKISIENVFLRRGFNLRKGWEAAEDEHDSHLFCIMKTKYLYLASTSLEKLQNFKADLNECIEDLIAKGPEFGELQQELIRRQWDYLNTKSATRMANVVQWLNGLMMAEPLYPGRPEESPNMQNGNVIEIMDGLTMSFDFSHNNEGDVGDTTDTGNGSEEDASTDAKLDLAPVNLATSNNAAVAGAVARALTPSQTNSPETTEFGNGTECEGSAYETEEESSEDL